MRRRSLATLVLCGAVCAAVAWLAPDDAPAQSAAEDCSVEVADGWTWFGRCIERRPHGRGELVSDAGDWAEGAFLDGRQHGHWTVRRANGDVESGPYVRGRRHGAWTLRRADGAVEKGPLVEGERHGRWTVSLPDGRTLSQDWRYGEPQEDLFDVRDEPESPFEPRSRRLEDSAVGRDVPDDRLRGRPPEEERLRRPPLRRPRGARPMTNADVRAMASAAPERVVARIENSAADFDTSLDALMSLSRAGVAPAVLDAMIRRDTPLGNEDVLEMTEAGVRSGEIVRRIEESAVDFDVSARELRALADAGVAPAVLEAMYGGPIREIREGVGSANDAEVRELRRLLARQAEADELEAARRLAERQQARETERQQARTEVPEEERRRAEVDRETRRRAAVALERKVFQVQEMVDEITRAGGGGGTGRARVWTRVFSDLVGGRNVGDTTSRAARDRERLRVEAQALVARTRRALAEVYRDAAIAGLDEVAAEARRAGMCLDVHDERGGRPALEECLRGSRAVLEEYAGASGSQDEVSYDELLATAVERLSARPREMGRAALANLEEAVRGAWLRLRTEY